VCFIRSPELYFNLVSLAGARIAKQQIEPTGLRLNDLFIQENQLAKAKYARIICNLLLKPALVEFLILAQ